MISSMTGFGAADGVVGDARASVEIRTVNHRFFSPNLKLPAAFARWEGEIRELLRQKIARGHVTLVARVDRPPVSTGPVIDETRLAQYAVALKELQKKHSLGGEVDLATVLRLPDVVTAPSEEMDSKAGEALAAIVSRAADNLIAMRRTEGGLLAAFLLERVAAVESRLARIESRAPEEIPSGSPRKSQFSPTSSMSPRSWIDSVRIWRRSARPRNRRRQTQSASASVSFFRRWCGKRTPSAARRAMRKSRRT
jgi:uncharacterized protein (TIGR00255 family)